MQEYLKNIKKYDSMPYLDAKRLQAESYLMECLDKVDKGSFSDFIMLGLDSRIPDVDAALSIGNVNFILNTIYRCYLKYPDRKINIMFEDELIKMLKEDFYSFYAAMDIINEQIQNEIRKKAPFMIKNEQVYIALKEGVLKYSESIKGKKYYAGYNYKNGLTGYIEELNGYTEQRGHKIL